LRRFFFPFIPAIIFSRIEGSAHRALVAAPNHLEQLVAEWLQHNGYFVRVSVPVGPRARGGYKGELDVVGVNLVKHRLIHVECSLDAVSHEARDKRFALKFERGRQYIKSVFEGIALPETLEQIVVLQFSSGKTRTIGGVRLVTVRELVHEIYEGLKSTSPAKGAISSNWPLLRTLQIAADAMAKGSLSEHRLISS
jgi:hypothetical protein